MGKGEGDGPNPQEETARVTREYIDKGQALIGAAGNLLMTYWRLLGEASTQNSYVDTEGDVGGAGEEY